MNHQEKIQKIQQLKKERNAVILAHNYQPPIIQDLADYTGDSLELSRIARDSDAEVILFCGVDFMAETAKILSPDKIVLVPDHTALCPMAEMITPDQLRELKKKHPGVPVMCYVNSSAAIKAESDICCTSANATELAKRIDSEEVIFVPDKSLGGYTGLVTGKRFILHDGYCPIHHRITGEHVRQARQRHPDAVVMSHPECTPEVLAFTDHVASTSGMLKLAKSLDATEFIICTDQELMHRLRKENPEKKFLAPCANCLCEDMKKTDLDKIIKSLENLQHRVEVSEDIRKKALGAIEKMVSTLDKK